LYGKRHSDKWDALANDTRFFVLTGGRGVVNLMRLVNLPAFVVSKGHRYYLRGNDFCTLIHYTRVSRENRYNESYSRFDVNKQR
jgi:hypothetical protein